MGLFVVLDNRNSTKNKVFGLFNFTSSLWLLSQFIADTSTNGTVALWSFRFALFFGQMVPLIFYYLVLVFPTTSKFKRKRQVVYGVVYTFIALLSFTSLNVAKVTVGEFGADPAVKGVLYSLSDALSVAVIAVAMVILFTKYKKTRNNSEKTQIRIMLSGVALVAIANIMTGIVLLTIIKNDTVLLLMGDFALLAFSMIVAYSMVRHGLFNVRLVVARSIGYVLSLAVFASIYSLIFFGALARFFGTSESTLSQQFLYVIVALVLASTFQTTKRYFDKLSNKIFYRDAYDPQTFLGQLNKNLVTSAEIGVLLLQSASIIEQYIKTEFCNFYLRDTDYLAHRYIGDANEEINEKEVSIIDKQTRQKVSRVLVTDSLVEKPDFNETYGILYKKKIGMLVRIAGSSSRDTKGAGYLVLGNKKSGNPYSEQDIKIMDIITNELSIAIQNALKFEEIEQFNITLQKKIDEATKALKKSNEKLRALDEAKDEFISMASHQLRTPLTSVKGYLSMLAEGDAGKLNETQHKFIDQAFISSQRMVYLIADLLNVSRLKTGKFIIESHPIYLPDVIESEIAQLYETVKARGLTMSYDKPKEFPTLSLDETKLRQVIMNFADNAIYYTPAGGTIVLALKQVGQSAEFTVTDDGMGVPRSEQQHLFTKFYRAGNARKARPDGTGLGLFMAKKVVVAQGGSLIFKSTEGKGSTFGFRFTVPEQ